MPAAPLVLAPLPGELPRDLIRGRRSTGPAVPAAPPVLAPLPVDLPRDLIRGRRSVGVLRCRPLRLEQLVLFI